MQLEGLPKVDTGGRAFPSDSNGCAGMCLRDWFAGMALAHPYTQGDDAPTNVDKTAEWAYSVADALIAVKRKTEKGL